MHDTSSENGILAVVTSVLMWALSLTSLLIYVQIGAGCVAMVSGIFAIRYYYLKGNEVSKRKKS